MSFNYTIKRISFNEFYSFLKDVELDFVPPLLSRIDVNAFYKKLSTYGNFIECYYGQELAGLSVSYDNNQENKFGYVSFIAVKYSYRGNNIAGRLLNLVEQHAKEAGMNIVKIDTNNEIAKACYIKNGYILQESQIIPEYNLTRYYLQKQL